MNSDATAQSYALGFIFSVILTLTAYGLVASRLSHLLSHAILIPLIVLLGIAQFGVQLFFFLHLGKKSTPRANTLMFLFALLIVSILVIGSLWIMYNLNYNMSPNFDVNAYMNSQDSL
jgi:cytochrome o ubiquinol oxidase subunit IV